MTLVTKTKTTVHFEESDKVVFNIFKHKESFYLMARSYKENQESEIELKFSKEELEHISSRIAFLLEEDSK